MQRTIHFIIFCIFKLYLFYSQCVGGEWKCSEEKCPGTCKIEEGLYVTTYDGKKFTLFGNCEYIVSHVGALIISGLHLCKSS